MYERFCIQKLYCTFSITKKAKVMALSLAMSTTPVCLTGNVVAMMCIRVQSHTHTVRLPLAPRVGMRRCINPFQTLTRAKSHTHTQANIKEPVYESPDRTRSSIPFENRWKRVANQEQVESTRSKYWQSQLELKKERRCDHQKRRSIPIQWMK